MFVVTDVGLQKHTLHLFWPTRLRCEYCTKVPLWWVSQTGRFWSLEAPDMVNLLRPLEWE